MNEKIFNKSLIIVILIVLIVAGTVKVHSILSFSEPHDWNYRQLQRIEKNRNNFSFVVFASALNLPLFSRTYGESILKRLREIIKEDKTKTYLFTVSTSAHKEKIRTLENAADNLMFTRNEKPMKLLLKITRMKDVSFSKKEMKVPLKTEDLFTIKSLAEGSRTDLIPVISKI